MATAVNTIPRIKDYRISQVVVLTGQVDKAIKEQVAKGLVIKAVDNKGNRTINININK